MHRIGLNVKTNPFGRKVLKMPPRKKVNLERNKKMLEGKAKKKVTVVNINSEIALSGNNPDDVCLETESDQCEVAVCHLAPHNMDWNNDGADENEQYIENIGRLGVQYVRMDEDDFDNEWDDVVGEFKVALRKAKLPTSMPDDVEMLEMDENRVVKFVSYQNPNRDVWHACCAVWAEPGKTTPYQITCGFTQFEDSLFWAERAKNCAERFLQNPTEKIAACRSVCRCIKEKLHLVDAFSLGIFVKEEGRNRMIQSKVKGLVRPLLDCYYKNDPPDYTKCLRSVNIKVMEIVLRQTRKMPKVNADAVIAFFQQLHDGDN